MTLSLIDYLSIYLYKITDMDITPEENLFFTKEYFKELYFFGISKKLIKTTLQFILKMRIYSVANTLKVIN